MKEKASLIFAGLISLLVLVASIFLTGLLGFLITLIFGGFTALFVYKFVKRKIKKKEKTVDELLNNNIEKIKKEIEKEKKSIKYREEVLNAREREYNTRDNNGTERNRTPEVEGTINRVTESISPTISKGTDDGQSIIQDREVESNDTTDTSNTRTDRSVEENREINEINFD